MATIIFDFDGTIADSFDYVTDFLERHVRGGRKLSAKEKQALRGMSMPQMAMHLGCSKWRLPLLFAIGRRAMSRAIYDVPLFEGMGRVIDRLHAEGHVLMIVSSNNNRNIRKFLRQHHLYKYFTDIYGGAGFFGKKRAIRKVIRRNQLQLKDSIYIGDESRDITASHEAGIRCVAVTWGFNSQDMLTPHKPAALAANPHDLFGILEEV